jgi:hypothetical protein
MLHTVGHYFPGDLVDPNHNPRVILDVGEVEIVIYLFFYFSCG